MKKGPGRPVHLRGAGKRQPPGSKVGRRAVEHSGGKWKGEIFHGGALTAAADERAGRPTGWARMPVARAAGGQT